MSKEKSLESVVNSHVREFKRLRKAKTNKECEVWLMPQIKLAASLRAIMDKMLDEIWETKCSRLTEGSTGQEKVEVNPLLAQYDKMQRTMELHYEALGLNLRMKDNQGGADEEEDQMLKYLKQSK